MIAVEQTHNADGFAALRVDTGAMAIELLPELGGKISSLRDCRSGREWLWRNPRLAYQRPLPGTSYVAEADSGGWDECFPSVAPCAYPSAPWAGTPIADHGELWAQAVQPLIDAQPHQVAITTTWNGAALPYRFVRTLRLEEGTATLRVEYAATNLSDAPLDFIWCAHPLLQVEPGMHLRLPAEANWQRWTAIPAHLDDAAIDLTALPPPSAAVALKIWSDPLPPGAGQATLAAADGALELRWDTALLPGIACWLNMGGWAGDGGTPYYNVGIEPCIGAQDSLQTAVEAALPFGTLPPHGTRSWWLEATLYQPT